MAKVPDMNIGNHRKPESLDDRPQYVRIGELLRKRIQRGTYPLDSLLPTEVELCEEFAISRHTVREALRRLTDDGLIQRRQGSGSRVIASEPHHNYVHVMRSLDQLFQYAADTRFIIATMQTEVPDPEAFAEVGLGEGTPWLVVRGQRLERDEDIPICESTVFINHDFVGLAQDLLARSGAIYSQIEERYDVEVAEVVQDIDVVPISRQAARALAVKPQTLAVRVRRRYLDTAQKLLIASVNYHPAERFSYSMQLRREGRRGPWI